MKTITKFLVGLVIMMGLNALGKVLFDIDPLSTEAVITIALAVTYCLNEDDKKS